MAVYCRLDEPISTKSLQQISVLLHYYLLQTGALTYETYQTFQQKLAVIQQSPSTSDRILLY